MRAWESLLEQLIDTRRSALVGYASVLTGSLSEAEDLVHDAVLRTFAKPRGLRDVEHAEAYVRRAIATTFLNGRRRHRRFVARMHLIAQPDSTTDAQQPVAESDAIRTALATLSPRERACVVLRHFEQMRVAEIADTLGLAQGSVKRYLADGMRKLGAQLAPDSAVGAADAVAGPVEHVAVAQRVATSGRRRR